jgi:CRISPR system Cascade subunit CasC
MTNSERLFIDVHILQTVPPSCVNRDDTGSPKTAVYGGVTRARVSSQAWKKATRDEFKRDVLGEDDIGVRTKGIAAMVAKYITGPHIDKADAASKILIAAGLQEKSTKAGKDAPLFFMAPAQAKALAELVDGGDYDKTAAKDALNSAPAIDIALFGRMAADNANLNIDASCQVAHAISTHKVENEYDYFTAVDDFPPEDKTDAGAGMIGTVEFNSSTLYRYATIALHDLERQLGGKEASAAAVKAFLQAFIRSMPTGKINTFANKTPPDYVLITLRGDTPVNLVGAFETPVKADGGYVKNSIAALETKEEEVYSIWYEKPKLRFVVGKDGNLEAVINNVYEAIKK